MRASCDRIDIDKQKTISQTLRFLYNARVYIMRASYDSIDNKLKQKMCGKVNKDITFIQFFHSTQLHPTEPFKIFFSLLILQLFFCKKLVGRKKWPANTLREHSLASQSANQSCFCFKVACLSYGEYIVLVRSHPKLIFRLINTN